jgi:DUF4097 and DUF4098 domain-containing protein YvlB
MPEFDRSTPVTVALKTQRGKVDITAEERTTVLVEIVPLDGSDASHQAATGTTVSLEGDTLAIRPPESSGWQLRRSPKLLITVKVPLDSSIAVKAASADLRAVGRFAQAHVNLASGDAYVEDVTGDANLEAASGDLTVRRVGGALRMTSSSGDLEVGDVNGDVSVETASGDITLRSAAASLRAETASGDIEIGVVREGETRIRSASGDVKIGVAAGTGVWLDINTASGSTRNELTMGADTPGASPESTGAKLELRIRTASGDVQIRRFAGDFPATV